MQTFCGLTTDGMLDYLAAIFRLAQLDDKVTTGALAESMCVTAPAASSMLKRLQDSGFVDRSSADGITLTEQGRIAALQLIRRHRLLEVFLIDIMGYTWDQVDAEAHRLEHSISPAFELRMDELCGLPTHCPHGDPIPSPDGVMPDEELVSIVEMQPGQRGLLRRVGNRDASVLRYLSKLSLTPGQIVKLVEAAPFKGPVTLELLGINGFQNGHATQIVGCELAEQLFILPQQA
jgi:DtxR family Mn-dependent transcriptional regulator